MKKLLYRLTKPSLQGHLVQEVIFTIPRVVCGYLLTADFGAAKFGLPWSPEDKNLGLFEVAFWFPNDVAQYGGVFTLFPAFLAWMGAFSEAVGGLALLLGFQTRLFSFLIVCTMLTAMFAQQFEAGLWNMLPAMGFLWVGMTHLVLGSGRFGLDYIITQKMENMKSINLIIMVGLGLLMTSCVQKAIPQKVVYLLDVSGVKNIETVGVRGADNPLSWETDLPMRAVVKDSLYRAEVTYITGYKITEVKFTVNGNFELQNEENRKIRFDEKQAMTEVKAVFNRIK